MERYETVDRTVIPTNSAHTEIVFVCAECVCSLKHSLFLTEIPTSKKKVFDTVLVDTQSQRIQLLSSEHYIQDRRINTQKIINANVWFWNLVLQHVM